MEQKAVNTLRMLSIDQVQKANSGHPGLPLGAAPMAYELWARHLKHNPKDPQWFNRDRFILSAGHGSALLYSMLHLFGYGLTMEDLKNFRQFGSKTPGHPEYGHTVGVEATTGPLGQGIAMAVGMALAEVKLAKKYNRDIALIDHYTYALCGDGDIMEGISNEASSFAGTFNLNKLIVLYDSNNITIEGSTDLSFKEDVLKRYEAMGWDVFAVGDGNNLLEISKALEEAKKSPHPAIIEIKTKIGYGSPREGMAKSHGEPLGEENIKKTREFYELKDKDFYVSEEVYRHFENLQKNFDIEYEKWIRVKKIYEERYPKEYQELTNALEGKMDLSFMEEESFFQFDEAMATRASSGQILNTIAQHVDNIFGGSADLGPSNKSDIKGEQYFTALCREGQNINFGIRENAMGAITNGILLHGGLRTYAATFLVFSDYLKPTIRLAALMNMPNIYIFTHDSIGVGEDGPTHQPVEQLAMLRSIPNMITFRPADACEVAVGWKVAMESKNTPVALILSRQGVPNLEKSSLEAAKGGYIVKKEEESLEKIIIATGSEVSLAVEAAKDLKNVRVVSMPSMELFEAQTKSYREEILPPHIVKRLSIEAGASLGWQKYTGLTGRNISIDEFGASGPAKEVFKEYGFTIENIQKVIGEL